MSASIAIDGGGNGAAIAVGIGSTPIASGASAARLSQAAATVAGSTDALRASNHDCGDDTRPATNQLSGESELSFTEPLAPDA